MTRQPVANAARIALILALVTLSAVRCAPRPGVAPAPLVQPDDQRFAGTAPDSFDVDFRTTKGAMLVRARRHWSPNGVDRFYALVRNHFFDSVAFHRTIRGFVAQFGIHGDTAVTRAWRGRTVPDDAPVVTNQRGTLSFARGGPNSRGTQLYFNLVDNARLDTLNTFGFPPVAQVIRGIEVMDSLYADYSSRAPNGPPITAPVQDSINRQGNAYLRRRYPLLDYIVTARVAKEWR